uniref:Uncharacterized protein n=1 Tax=Anguilla anguilla TaxID=7936 RepID=A0A0E9TXX3_ANGAN
MTGMALLHNVSRFRGTIVEAFP